MQRVKRINAYNNQFMIVEVISQLHFGLDVQTRDDCYVVTCKCEFET